LFHGDWIAAARSLEPGSVDLVYVDPPFNTGATRVSHAGAFADEWATIDDYLAWMRARLIATVPAVRATGSVLVHVDWRASHRVRMVLDEVLGADRFVNHLVWSYGLGGSSPRRFARKHDDILFYCIDPERYWFEAPQIPATSRRMAGQTKKATDVIDIPSINNMAVERVGWPTQKPLALLEMLVGACCPPGGVVVDPCCGSGTTVVSAARSGRRGLGADIDARAIELTRMRVSEVRREGPETRTPQP
jgi:DNA modification methylase